MSATASQRISFTQLVLDMGLADRKALLKAKKLIKERKAEGQKLTLARACVELEVLTERQAKKVQLELKRLKAGLTASNAFEGDEAKAEKPKKKRKKKPAGEDASTEAKVDEAKVDEAKAEKPKKKAKKAKQDDDASDEAKATPADEAVAEAKPKKKAKKAKQDDDASDEAKATPADEAEPKKKAKKAKQDDDASDEAAVAEAKPKKKAKKAEPEEADADAVPAEADAEPAVEEDAAVAEAKPKKRSGTGKIGRPGARKSGTGPAAKKRSGTARATRPGKRGAAEGEAPTGTSKTPIMALAGLVGVLVIGVGGYMVLGGSSPKPSESASVNTGASEGETPAVSEDPVEVVTPPEEQPEAPAAPSDAEKLKEEANAAWNKAVLGLDLADEGDLEGAIAKLEEFPERLRKQEVWTAEGALRLKELKEKLAVKKELDAALEAGKGGDKKALEAAVKKVESPGYAMSGEAFVDAFKNSAEEVLGVDGYERVLGKLRQEQDREAFAAVGSESEDSERNLGDLDELNKEPEIELRGTPERRERFKREAESSKQALAAAQDRVNARRAARQAKIASEAKRVIDATQSKKIKFGDGESAEVTAYTEDGFTAKIGSRTQTFGWGNAPRDLGPEVKRLAIDPKDGAQHFDLGLYALKMGQFESAKVAFVKAVELDDSFKGKIPDVDSLRFHFDTFRGQASIKEGAPSTIVWKFDGDRLQEKLDFSPMGQGIQVEVVGGKLKISSMFPGVSFMGGAVRGEWEDQVTLDAVLGSAKPAPAIGFSSDVALYLVEFGDSETSLVGFGQSGKETIAKAGTGAKPGTKVSVGGSLSGETLTITVKVDGNKVLEHQVAWDEELNMMVGALGSGEVRFDEITATGVLNAKWLRRAKAAGPNEMARALSEFERETVAGAAGKVPAAWAKTSAEDEVALAGIPDSAVAKLDEARDLLAQGQMAYGTALQKIEEAGRASFEFHAAHYLWAALMFRRDPEGALYRCDRVLRGVEDFFEAKVVKAECLMMLGRADEARSLVSEALSERPGYAPAHVAQANLFIVDGEYAKAYDTLEVADELSPGDPTVQAIMMRAQALFEGPAWANGKQVDSEWYALNTDYVDDAERLSNHLEAIRARYEEAFPNLKNPAAKKRKSSVLVFREPEDYYRYSYRTTQDRSENTLGHFNPSTGQLLLFLDADIDEPGSLHVVYHEGTHQWSHGQGVSLPFWANEGIAEYVGGTILSDDGEIKERAITDPFLKKRLQSLSGNWQNRKDFIDIMSETPGEFYSGFTGLKYAQAWTMVHFFMESGLEVELHEGGTAKIKDLFVDYLNKFKNVQRESKQGMKLQYVYLETFYGIANIREVQNAWERWVKQLCDDAGVPFEHEIGKD
ncbi:MAG: tetratricopeptide repeat protein [Planctomycetota bacterium]